MQPASRAGAAIVLTPRMSSPLPSYAKRASLMSLYAHRTAEMCWPVPGPPGCWAVRVQGALRDVCGLNAIRVTDKGMAYQSRSAPACVVSWQRVHTVSSPPVPLAGVRVRGCSEERPGKPGTGHRRSRGQRPQVLMYPNALLPLWHRFDREKQSNPQPGSVAAVCSPQVQQTAQRRCRVLTLPDLHKGSPC